MQLAWYTFLINQKYFVNEIREHVIVRGCRALTFILPGADGSRNPYEWFSKGFHFAGDHHDSAEIGYLFEHLYEWRLNMLSGDV